MKRLQITDYFTKHNIFKPDLLLTTSEHFIKNYKLKRRQVTYK